MILHGGHMRAGLALGEEVFAARDCTVLVPSRPGYGGTPLASGRTPAEFADRVAELCARLGIEQAEAVVGISAGGPTAVALAARHPALASRLVLMSAVGPMPWPDAATRRAARIGFHPAVEGAVWGAVRQLLRVAPDAGLRLLLRDLTTLPARALVTGLRADERDQLAGLFSRMRSGRGFANDLVSVPDLTAQVDIPTLVIASRRDGSVPFAHAEALAGIRHAQLWESDADSHFVWFGDGREQTAARLRAFLDTPVA
ncbi:alpha/beta hydrolase [Streptomyces sp. NBC_00237]|uniref:alpha/beta fold hydrolase n=1 Tax=Streptomyces sp. NBC_00237 TaxID=2975687 RepID=UPI002258D6A2|nr:alpha/beta hydrolase [Streptomyces sp. NBC_00237]MCX5205799.1 alpha/beta hydrolase [Streptomyces sp. NBC_00237]